MISFALCVEISQNCKSVYENRVFMRQNIGMKLSFQKGNPKANFIDQLRLYWT